MYLGIAVCSVPLDRSGGRGIDAADAEMDGTTNMATQRIVVLGAGDIGATLGGKWAAAGHSVVFGVRNPESEKVAALRDRLGDQAKVTTMADAIVDSDVVLLAVTGQAVPDLAEQFGAWFNGRIVIDATNQRFKGAAEATGEWGEQVTLNSVDVLRKYAPESTLVRAFHHYSWEIFADPQFGDRRPDLFYCGPDGDTQRLVDELIEQIGVRPVRAGDVDQVEAVDHLLELWASLSIFQGRGRSNVAFAMLER